MALKYTHRCRRQLRDFTWCRLPQQRNGSTIHGVPLQSHRLSMHLHSRHLLTCRVKRDICKAWGRANTPTHYVVSLVRRGYSQCWLDLEEKLEALSRDVQLEMV